MKENIYLQILHLYYISLKMLTGSQTDAIIILDVAH